MPFQYGEWPQDQIPALNLGGLGKHPGTHIYPKMPSVGARPNYFAGPPDNPYEGIKAGSQADVYLVKIGDGRFVRLRNSERKSGRQP